MSFSAVSTSALLDDFKASVNVAVNNLFFHFQFLRLSIGWQKYIDLT